MQLECHEEFFDFIREREQIRLCKEAGESFPWTEDKILQEYKFTNVRREHDRTSRELVERFYTPNRSDSRESILMNAALFRYFGTYEFASAVGWQDYDDFQFDFIKQTAKERLEAGERVFTGAYVITNQGIKAPKYEVVVDHFLKDLHEEASGIVKLAMKTNSWEEVCKRMSYINGFGGTGFMTKEITLDTMYTNFWKNDNDNYPADYRHWTPIGPGGLRGAARVLGNINPSPASISRENAFNVIMELISIHDEHWPKDWGELFPTDIQFQLCEFDKYERVRRAQGRPRSRYRVVV